MGWVFENGYSVRAAYNHYLENSVFQLENSFFHTRKVTIFAANFTKGLPAL